MVDYLVVGLGLAGMAFCEQLEAHGKTYKVISDASQTSSVVAGGMYNPVILKRFTPAWNAASQLQIAIPFYEGLEKKLQVALDVKVPIYRKFASVEEQNMWFEASDKPQLSPFLKTTVHPNQNKSIDAAFGYGEVLQTGRIDTEALLKGYQHYLEVKDIFRGETFQFSTLKIEDDGITYNDIKAKRIVFCTGFGLKENPYFNYLPLNGTKGELLTIKAPLLKEEHVIKSSVFIIPLGNDLYKVGATYNWDDKSNTPTDAAKDELLSKLDTFLKCPYEVVQHVAGIRPTVKDRKPLVGQHPEYANLYILNGLGTRGALIAPTAAQQLYQYIEEQVALPAEVDINRFQ